MGISFRTRLAVIGSATAALALGIAGTAAAVTAPVAGFSVQKPGGLSIVLNLDNATHHTSVDPSATNATYTIDWGDGMTTVLGTPRPKTVPHTYAVSGRFTVTETVDDGLGDAPVSYSATASVSDKQQAAIWFDPASRTQGPLMYGALVMVHWSVDPSAAVPNPRVTIDFGDGTAPVSQYLGQAAGFDVSHQYAVAGTYTVTAKVNDGLHLTTSVGTATTTVTMTP